MKQKSLDILKEFASQYQIDWRLLFANLKCENRDLEGFNPDGTIRSRFEPAIHKKLQNNKLYNLDPKWLEKHSDYEKVIMATSWGIGQIMGWHYSMLDFSSPMAMKDAFKIEEMQIRKYCEYVVKANDGKLLKAFQKESINLIAKLFNGAGYKQNNYDTHLMEFRHDAEKYVPS